jgi:hypothetical protein
MHEDIHVSVFCVCARARVRVLCLVNIGLQGIIHVHINIPSCVCICSYISIVWMYMHTNVCAADLLQHAPSCLIVFLHVYTCEPHGMTSESVRMIQDERMK